MRQNHLRERVFNEDCGGSFNSFDPVQCSHLSYSTLTPVCGDMENKRVTFHFALVFSCIGLNKGKHFVSIKIHIWLCFTGATKHDIPISNLVIKWNFNITPNSTKTFWLQNLHPAIIESAKLLLSVCQQLQTNNSRRITAATTGDVIAHTSCNQEDHAHTSCKEERLFTH